MPRGGSAPSPSCVSGQEGRRPQVFVAVSGVGEAASSCRWCGGYGYTVHMFEYGVLPLVPTGGAAWTLGAPAGKLTPELVISTGDVAGLLGSSAAGGELAGVVEGLLTRLLVTAQDRNDGGGAAESEDLFASDPGGDTVLAAVAQERRTVSQEEAGASGIMTLGAQGLGGIRQQSAVPSWTWVAPGAVPRPVWLSWCVPVTRFASSPPVRPPPSGTTSTTSPPGARAGAPVWTTSSPCARPTTDSSTPPDGPSPATRPAGSCLGTPPTRPSTSATQTAPSPACPTRSGPASTTSQLHRTQGPEQADQPRHPQPPNRAVDRALDDQVHEHTGLGTNANGSGRAWLGTRGPQPGQRAGDYEVVPYPQAAHTLGLAPLIDAAPPF